MEMKTTTKQMNDLVAQIVKEQDDHAALNIFATAIALATTDSDIASRVGDIADEFDDGSREDEDDEDALEEGVTPEDYRRDQAADGLINEEGFDAHGNPIAE
jgi:hypothetical protein